jgi:hypothetical protein
MMDFFGPGVEAAETIGLYPRLAAAAYRLEGAEYVDAAGRPTARLDYAKFSRLAGGKVLTLMRPDMERARWPHSTTSRLAACGSVTAHAFPARGAMMTRACGGQRPSWHRAHRQHRQDRRHLRAPGR